MRHLLRYISPFFIILAMTLSSCGTKRIAPITGRKYRVIENSYSDAQMLSMAKAEYDQYIYSLGGDSRDSKESRRVKKIANDLIYTAVNYLKNNGYENELKYYEWDVRLVPAPGLVNATCMPGGKIVVYEGILPIADNDAGLAAILGHEIGHAIAHHAAERFSQDNKKRIWQGLGALGLGIAGAATGGDVNTVTDVISNTISLSNQIMQFVELKYSRKHEYEADHIGMILMAMAGYDPREAPRVWERMTQYLGDTDMRILSTHPSNKNRMKKMREKWMSEAMALYSTGNGSTSNNISNITDTKRHADNGKNTPITTSYTVNANNLNVRSEPSTNSRIIGKLKKGEIIDVVTIHKGWARIIYNEQTGYISSKYICK